ncbi:MAG: DNA polymerase III subunit beta [Gammaproteobacteria bacterium]|nr:DNA polymerase III subunit beta [Gammaproteobacteria bacterium]
MKLLLNRDELLAPLSAVHNVVERRQSLPILANVLVVVEPGSVTFTGTDMEVETVTTLNCDAKSAATVTLPARKLLDIVRALPAGAPVELNLGDKQAVIRSGRSRFALSTLPAAEFPNIGDFEAAFTVRLDGAGLRALIEQTQFAMAHNDVRYYLNGLLLEFGAARLRSVATDGHRLAMSEVDLATEIDAVRQLIVPRKGVSELLRVLEPGAEVELAVSDNHLRIRSGGQCVTSKLIDGKYPDYERVLPRGGDKEVLADREALRQMLARTSILSNEKFRGIRLSIKPGSLTASAHNPEQEEAEEQMEVEYEGGELEVGFNATYLLDVLGTVKADVVKMVFLDANNSCLLSPVGDERTRYVIMPMRL